MKLHELVFTFGIIWESDVFIHSQHYDFLINGVPAHSECQELKNGDEVRFGYNHQYYWVVGRNDDENISTSKYNKTKEEV